MANDEKNDQKEYGRTLSFNGFVAVVGFIGGMLWSAIGYFAFYLNFTRIGPALILLPWAFGDWKNGWLGQVVGIVFIGILSIAASFLYRLFFAKFYKPWLGIIYGFVAWIIVFGLLNPMFPGLKTLKQLDLNTVLTTCCLYILWGLFIGYSISYEYRERTVNEGESIQS